MKNKRIERAWLRVIALGRYRSILLVAIDLFGTYASYALAFALTVAQHPQYDPKGLSENYRFAVILALLIQPFLFDTFGLYRAWRGDSPLREVMRSLTAWAMLLGALVMLAGLTKTTDSYSRIWFVSWSVIGAIWLLVSHSSIWMLAGLTRRIGYNHKRILLIGDDASAHRVVRALSDHLEAGFEPVAYCADQPSGDPVLRLLPYGGPMPNASTLQGVDQIWLAFSSTEHQNLRRTLDQLQHVMIPIRLVPNLLSVRLLSAPVGYAAGMTMFDLNAVPVQGMTRIIKEVVDRVGAVAALVVLSPLLLLIAVGIKLSSSGTVFFRQDREGHNGRVFSIYKFRTMHSHRAPDDEVRQATRDDPRTFRLGYWLRRFSLDELPQLFNVIKGDMSLVGPRPHAVQHSEEYRPLVEFYGWRQMVKPGITGWAQIHGLRGETDVPDKMRQRVEYDLFYVRNWSLWLDFEIMLLTLVRGFTNSNAY